jgi:hypothetical protein
MTPASATATQGDQEGIAVNPSSDRQPRAVRAEDHTSLEAGSLRSPRDNPYHVKLEQQISWRDAWHRFKESWHIKRARKVIQLSQCKDGV